MFKVCCGLIISLTSADGMRWDAYLHAYIAPNSGIINLTQGVALTVGKDKIRLNCICPGMIATPSVLRNIPGGEQEVRQMMEKAQPIPKAGAPDDIAAV